MKRKYQKNTEFPTKYPRNFWLWTLHKDKMKPVTDIMQTPPSSLSLRDKSQVCLVQCVHRHHAIEIHLHRPKQAGLGKPTVYAAAAAYTIAWKNGKWAKRTDVSGYSVHSSRCHGPPSVRRFARRLYTQGGALCAVWSEAALVTSR